MNLIIDSLLQIVFPTRCPGCDKVLAVGERGFCGGCTEQLHFLQEPLCPYCGKPIDRDQMCCADCRAHPHSFTAGGAVLLYTGQMQESMARFKQGGRAEYGKVYGRLLWDAKREWLQRIREPVLVPVPVHSKRYRKRGYNQAEEIAKEMARLSGLPMRSDLLVRVKHTAPQKELSKRERSRNLQGAFRCRADYRKLCLQGKCAIIIDDIYTTGSTVEACSQTLLQAGFDKVYFLCVCIGKGV